MASIVTWVAAGLAWCFCTAAGSLLGSCCGNDKPSTVPPGANSGRKRSVLLLVMSIIIAVAFQYGIAPAITGVSITNYVTDAWLDGCEKYDTNLLEERCATNASVYRVASSASLFYLLAGIAVTCKPSANREAWPAKYVLFLFLVAGMCFIPNDPVFLKVYLNIARVGGIIFILLQQVILVDLAHNWNDSWVRKADEAESEEMGSGKKYLAAILVSAGILFTGSFVGIVLLYIFFADCSINTAFISVTLVFILLMTGIQLSGEEGSLLCSSALSAYGVCLCYNAVSKNPDEKCNPFLGERDVLGILFGLGMTIISIGWAGWSFTADERLSGKTEGERNEEFEYKNHTAKREGESKVTGVVTGNQSYGTGEDGDGDDNDGDKPPSPPTEEEIRSGAFENSWKLNAVLGLVSCWFAMALTGWGSIQSGGDVANPEAGRVSMWMIIASQWIAFTLYVWTLVAPRLFPDRDFS